MKRYMILILCCAHQLSGMVELEKSSEKALSADTLILIAQAVCTYKAKKIVLLTNGVKQSRITFADSHNVIYSYQPKEFNKILLQMTIRANNAESETDSVLKKELLLFKQFVTLENIDAVHPESLKRIKYLDTLFPKK